MATVSLDSGRYHGVVTPPHMGAHYCQDGFFFDAVGNLVENLLTDADRERLKKRPKGSAPAAKTNQASANDHKRDKAQGHDTYSVEIDGKTIDLVAFAKNDPSVPKAPYFKLQGAVKQKYGWGIPTKLSLISELVDAGAMQADDGDIGDADKEEED